MLDTILEIGKTLRNSPDGLKHHRYVKACPKNTEKNRVLRLSLPVNEDFSFDFNNIREISDEYVADHLFYLTFKTSDADSFVKYIFGDIFYSLVKGEEKGYYRLGDEKNKQKYFQISSFWRGVEDSKILEEMSKLKQSNNQSFLKTFRQEFEKNILNIENIFRYQCGIRGYLNLPSKDISFLKILSEEQELKKLTAKTIFFDINQQKNKKQTFKNVLNLEEPEWALIEANPEMIQRLISYSTSDLFLHFDFKNKHWYEFEEDFKIINSKILEDFAEKIKTPRGDKYVLKKYLYKTLSSPEKDLQFPSFNEKMRYCNKTFENTDEILDLFYAIDYSKTALIKIPKTDIKIVVLPKGKYLTANDYQDFIKQKKSLSEEQEEEEIVNQKNVPNDQEQLFTPLVENIGEKIIKFDLIFSKQGGATTPDVDIVEISGLEKSKLSEIHKHIQKVKKSLYHKREMEIKAKLSPFSITWSFLNILDDSTSKIKKYQNHLYKTLPLIYTGSYYDDPILLTIFIEKTELNIRSNKSNFNILKYDFIFLVTIQNTVQEGENFMKIQESQSYKIGNLLGDLAKQFAAWREDCPIKSFEKSYVGTLSRRIATIEDLLKFKTFIEEKLILHERTSFTHQTSIKLSQQIKEFQSSSEKYDKHKCAFGFFENYFSTTNKKES